MKKYIYIIILTIFISCKDKNLETKTNSEARSVVVQSSEINDKIAKGEAVLYKNVTIIGDIDFTKSQESYIEARETRRHYIKTGITFFNCTIKGKVIANSNDKKEVHLVTFDKNLTFLKCTFQDDFIFNNSLFNGIVNISESIFQSEFTIVGTAFNFTKNYFIKNTFQGAAKFIGARLNGDISFLESKFNKVAIFQNNKFLGDAQFSSTVFNENADFSGITSNFILSFNYTEFNKKVMFNNSVFSSRTDFIQTKFNGNAEFKNVKYYGHTRYNKSIINRVIIFNKSLFILGKPEMENIEISEKAKIEIENTLYLQDNSLKEIASINKN